MAVALADKLETLVGLFGIGQLPTGDKDPFALRRHALGVIRMLIERELAAGRSTHWCCTAFEAFAAEPRPGAGRSCAASCATAWSATCASRATARRRSTRCWRCGPTRWAEVPKRLAAVRAFAALPEAPALAAANKRVGNILKKADGATPARGATPRCSASRPRRRCTPRCKTCRAAADAAFDAGDYTASLQALAALKAPVDAFFDAVMVNAEDPALRANRLALLAPAARGDEPRGRPVEAGGLKQSMNRGRPMQPIPKLVILDRDGILNEDRDDHVKAPEEWVPMPGALEAVARLNHAGWHVVVATNQSGIGRGLIDMATLNAMHVHMHAAAGRRGRAHRRGVLLPARARGRLRLPQAAAGPVQLDIGERYGVDLRAGADGRRHAARPAGRRSRRLRAAPGAHRPRRGARAPPRWPSSCAQVPGTRVHARPGRLCRLTCCEREHAA